MKKKLFMLCVVGTLALSGCGAKDKQATTGEKKNEMTQEDLSSQVQDESTTKTEENSAEATTEEVTISIAEEMAEIEKKSLEFENADWDLPQQEMNRKAYDWYMLWDDELNSLWARLMEKIPADKKDNMIIVQNDWIKRKEQNVIAAGVPSYGGSMQPLLEHSMAKDMTRKQAYYLAACLGEVIGEGYNAPAEVEESYKDVDINLSDVFEAFSGTHSLGGDIELCISRIEDSDYTADNFPDGTSWLTWYSHGDILTDFDVYAYTNEIIVFRKNDIYYVVQKEYDGDGLIMTVGTELGFMDYIGE